MLINACLGIVFNTVGEFGVNSPDISNITLASDPDFVTNNSLASQLSTPQNETGGAISWFLDSAQGIYRSTEIMIKFFNAGYIVDVFETLFLTLDIELPPGIFSILHAISTLGVAFFIYYIISGKSVPNLI